MFASSLTDNVRLEDELVLMRKVLVDSANTGYVLGAFMFRSLNLIRDVNCIHEVFLQTESAANTLGGRE